MEKFQTICRVLLSPFSGLANILFLDIPSLIDSTWRRFDHKANAEHKYVPNSQSLEPRPFWKTPPFWFFAVLVFSVAYGPTGSSLCSAAPEWIIDYVRWALVLLIAIPLLLFAWRYIDAPWRLVTRRFDRTREQAARTRVVLVTLGAYGSSLVVLLAFLGGVWKFLQTWPDCTGAKFALESLLSLVLCVVVIGVVGFIGSRLSQNKTILTGASREAPYAHLTIRLIYMQVAAIVGVALIHSVWLSNADVREADHLPYLHLFLFWASAIVLVLLAAPPVAWFMFCKKRRKGQAIKLTADDIVVEARRFRRWLRVTELFENRGEPPLNGRRLFFALIYGPVYHLLHLMLLPALVALAMDPKWLNVSVAVAFFLSLLLLMWGHISTRWDEMNVQMERWFLRGGPLFVSVAVILIGTLRVMQVDYISTILDALPFGTIFGGVVMTYVLFWFMEYWLNRIAGVKLLRLLGAGTDEICIKYRRRAPIAPGGVSKDGRFIALQGTGRFVALGPPFAAGKEVPFNSFGFLGLFVRLGEHAQTTDEGGYVKDFERRLANYFFTLNLAMLAITGCFIWHYAQSHLFAINGMDPLLNTRSSVPPARPVDLAELLVEKEGQTGPAIVVVGSGGGTRAALYTASVLRGLHGLGVDKNIVLLSGVSGGGVALAYFAANHDGLVAAPREDDAGCPPDAKSLSASSSNWNCFDESMAKPFIQDVLNGATEWRQFSKIALSKLLAESFERRLFKDRTLASLTGPAIILNATVVSHPADASELLRSTLNDPAVGVPSDEKCGEAERTFRMLSGGRMVFSNLKDTDRFPQGKERIPDVRLPYRIVRADDVSLATAAALNANFPPVFPNARVRILDAQTGDCPARSYYVTDGGAVENLGLLSALYALQSAIAKIPGDRTLRPIHIVLAEASAVDYDYGQDRGFSTMSGSRERLAGGLTETLIDTLERDNAHPKLEFYYLGLPLAFRARGGFGTHWMYADQYRLSDPRPRDASKHYIREALFGDGRAAVDRQALRKLWRALHNPDKQQDFCHAVFENDTKTVQSWICGDCKTHPEGQDLHMREWRRLLDQLGPKSADNPKPACWR